MPHTKSYQIGKSSSSQLPKNWPSELHYLRALTYTPNLEPQYLHVPRSSISPIDVIINPVSLPAPAPHVRITPIADSSHPAHGQFGLFAARSLPPSSLIVLYLGRAHGETEADPESDYDVRLDRELGIGIDAAREGNEARFVNDYRGIRSDGPNAELRDVWMEAGEGIVERRIGVFVLGAGRKGRKEKGIVKGEEIVVSYGKGFWNERKDQENGKG